MGSAPGHEPDQIYVALGSNLGHPLDNLREGARRLHSLVDGRLRLSHPWLTRPVDCPPGSSPFANAVAALEPVPSLTAISVLQACQQFERDLGRQPKTQLNEPRPLDLDIIAFREALVDTPTLILPHPRAHLRFFVLAPMNELCPNYVLPGHTRTIAQYLSACEKDPSARCLEDFEWHLPSERG